MVLLLLLLSVSDVSVQVLSDVHASVTVVLSSVLVPVIRPVPVLVAVHPALSSWSLCVVLCGPVYSITDSTRWVFDNINVTKKK